MMRIVKAQLLSLALLGPLSLTGCQKGELFQIDQASLLSSEQERVDELEIQKDSLYGEFNSDCFNQDYDACLFKKSPVAQSGGPLIGGELSFASDLLSLQTYSVKIRGLDGSGYLQNSSLEIHPASGDRPMGSDWKINYNEDTDQVLSQVMSYYWANLTKEVLELRTEKFYAKDQGVKIYTADTVTGWSAGLNEIHLQTTDTGNQMALDGSLVVHFMGMANLHHATEGAINTIDPTMHESCGEGSGVIYENGCCTSENGCAKALAAGIADYHVALVFPENTALGETWLNQSEGMSSCVLSRDISLQTNITKTAAYNACQSEDRSGDIYALGTYYASLWWRIRSTLNEVDQLSLDKLFTEHLALLDGQDDFQSALEKAQTADQNISGGRLGDLLVQEFNRR